METDHLYEFAKTYRPDLYARLLDSSGSDRDAILIKLQTIASNRGHEDWAAEAMKMNLTRGFGV